MTFHLTIFYVPEHVSADSRQHQKISRKPMPEIEEVDGDDHEDEEGEHNSEEDEKKDEKKDEENDEEGIHEKKNEEEKEEKVEDVIHEEKKDGKIEGDKRKRQGKGATTLNAMDMVQTMSSCKRPRCDEHSTPPRRTRGRPTGRELRNKAMNKPRPVEID